MNTTVILLSLCGLLLPSQAFAMGSFPSQIQSHLGLATAPHCNICHASTSGGGPVVQPFGKAMLAAGLTRSGGSTLTRALDKLAQDKTDSNGDGTSDIDELKVGANPNPDKTPPEYGCGAQIANQRPTGWSATVAALLMFVGLMSRRSLGKSNRCSRVAHNAASMCGTSSTQET